jgi:hypothetical protein
VPARDKVGRRPLLRKAFSVWISMNNEAAASRRGGRKPVPQLGQKVPAILETLEEYPLSFQRSQVATHTPACCS